MILWECVILLGSDLEWMGASEGAMPSSPDLPTSSQQTLQADVLASGTACDDDGQSPLQGVPDLFLLHMARRVSKKQEVGSRLLLLALTTPASKLLTLILITS